MMNTGNRGITLLIAIIVTFLVLSVGLSLSTLSVKELTIANTVLDSLKAIYASESGAECATYWVLQYEDYFSAFDTATIYCNGEPFTVGGSLFSQFTLSQDGVFVSNVAIYRQTPNGQLFDIEVGGYNSNPDATDDFRTVERSLTVSVTEICTFDPTNVDSFDDEAPDVSSFAEFGTEKNALQNSLDYFYPPAGTIDVINDQQKYQLWRLNKKGTVYISIKPLAGLSASYSNVFGYYINDGTLSDPNYILQNRFVPLYKNHVSSVYPTTFYPEIPNLTSDDGDDLEVGDSLVFKISTDENSGIGFAIFSDKGTEPRFKLSELALNIGSQFTDPASRDFVVAYDVPLEFLSDSDTPKYVIAFEDRASRSSPTDSNYNDIVAEIEILNCVVTVERF